MSSVTVQPGQSLADVAIQHCGSMEAVASIARLNEINITDLPATGTVLQIPAVFDKRVARILKDGDVVPASSEDGISVNIDLPAIIVDISASYNIPGAVVQPGQSLADVAIQHLGGLSGFVALAQLNGLGVTDEVAAGTRLELPSVVNQSVAEYMENGQHAPASNVLDELEGIGYWGIEYDFIVS